MKIDKEQRIRKAEQLFVQGYNCSQAVVAAFADIYGFTPEQALRLSAGMGGGMGRLRMTCGAVSAMAILAGMDCGSTDATDREGKSRNYKVVQQLCEKFKAEHGSLVCAQLLNLRKGAPLSYEASERTAEYYKTRPCVNMVVTAAKIFADYLEAF
ncbi:MAG: C-GCAxxG-C-C family protein [Prevotellaceae bacterium]|nr:C-GCAxxG-C-C family protein [Prevotellaceae bacterium]